MPVSDERPSAEDVAYFNSTVRNAKRLAADAIVLVQAGRTKSAIMLAIFAIEELGKALISIWGARKLGNKRLHPTHVEKQTATFALLAAVELDELVMTPGFVLPSFEEANFHGLGPMNSQFAYARSGFFDKVRMSVTYADRSPEIDLDQLGEDLSDLPSELLQWFEKAGESFVNSDAMQLAAITWENDLGRL